MKGKKVLSVLLASVMMFTAVPVGSMKHWGNGCTSPECTGAGAESEDTGREWSFQYRSRL